MVSITSAGSDVVQSERRMFKLHTLLLGCHIAIWVSINVTLQYSANVSVEQPLLPGATRRVNSVQKPGSNINYGVGY